MKSNFLLYFSVLILKKNKFYFRFAKANELIELKYNNIEVKLIDRFHNAFYTNDKKMMKKYITILSNFRVYLFIFLFFLIFLELIFTIKGYQNCISQFIKNCQYVNLFINSFNNKNFIMKNY
jgi:hypothetical protein